MKETFRKSMSLLHTWAGVVIGSLLFAIFWMGTLSVFDREIDRWMMPATRLAAPPASVSLDATVRPAAGKLTAGSPQWFVTLPTERTPTLRFGYHDAASDGFVSRHIDPRTGTVLPDQKSLGGSGFIFPFHFSLHLRWFDIGYWLVGLAGMAMLVLLASGVVIHHKILVDFFTFRPKKTLPRSSLDLHNLTGVLALPFHFVMALSGLCLILAWLRDGAAFGSVLSVFLFATTGLLTAFTFAWRAGVLRRLVTFVKFQLRLSF